MNPQSPQQQIHVLMVCLGNICRSPTAHGVLQKLIDDNGLSELVKVESAGISRYHIGSSPDNRSASAASLRGYDLSDQRARQLADSDYQQFNYILAMDRANLEEIEGRKPVDSPAHTSLLLDFAAEADYSEVPDPYYSGADGFEVVLDLVENACGELLAQIISEHNLDSFRK